jgi:flavin-dependent dehydrogenase
MSEQLLNNKFVACLSRRDKMLVEKAYRADVTVPSGTECEGVHRHRVPDGTRGLRVRSRVAARDAMTRLLRQKNLKTKDSEKFAAV